MNLSQTLKFKIASKPWEYEQIYKLNYRTFVEEIPQHHPNEDRQLIDRFNDQNTYIVCLRDETLIGMIAVRDKRPFSLDLKINHLNQYLPIHQSVCEVRLLSVEKGHRNGMVLRGLILKLYDLARERGYDLALISGITKQRKLYESLGFIAFGPLLGKGEAAFQPMYLKGERFSEVAKMLSMSESRGIARNPSYFLSGPVQLKPEVLRELGIPPISHRSRGFIQDFSETKRLLCDLAGATNVEILLGSGTLANDAIAGQISLLHGRGLVLSNGEFGDRLIDHANRWNLDFRAIQSTWGGSFQKGMLEEVLEQNHNIKWVWAVHCETSTGVLNDLQVLKRICREKNILLCLDCVSSIGTVPIELTDVYLASGVSGKALGGLTGLCMVFYNHQLKTESKTLPRYLDLGWYAANDGIPFSASSNLIYALKKALESFDLERVRQVREDSASVRAQLRNLGFNILVDDEIASPAVITIVLPPNIPSSKLGSQLESSGFCTSYMSEYLHQRNWIQIALMAEYNREDLNGLLSKMRELTREVTLQAG